MRKFIPLFIIGAAFGVVEGSVVVYLRPLLNPGHSDFLLRVVPVEILNHIQHTAVITELGREIATLVLLAAVAALAAKNFLTWVSYFVFTFAVWDIVYYIWIYVRIGWPSSLLEWDILFMIPVLWFAPVIVPVVISLIGISIALLMVRAYDLYGMVRVRLYHWVPVVSALIIWQVSFVNKTVPGMTEFPGSYSWWLFYLGIASSMLGVVLFVKDFFFDF